MREYIPSEFDLHQRIDIPYSREQYFYIEQLMIRMLKQHKEEALARKLYQALTDHALEKENKVLDDVERRIEKLERMMGAKKCQSL